MTEVDPQLLLAQTAWLRCLARQLVRDPHLADDVVQDTWVAALSHPPHRAHSEGRLRRWLGRVAENSARMRRRGDARRAARERAAARAEHVPAVHPDESILAHGRLLDAVLSLPDADREVVVKRYFEGLPPRTIARQLGCTSVAVRSRLSRTLAVLRARLARDQRDPRTLALALLPLLDRRSTATATTATFTPGGVWLMKTTTKALLAIAILGGAATSWLLWDRGTDAAHPTARFDTASTGAIGSLRNETSGATRDENDASIASGGEPEREVVAKRPAVPSPRTDTRLVVVARCVDPAGQPIEGAHLTAAHVVGRPSVVTDRDGRATLEVAWPAELTDGNHHWIVVEAAGESLTTLTRREPVQDTGVLEISLGELVLSPGGALSGSVRDVDGEPAARARVWVVQGATASSGPTEEHRRVYGEGFTGLGDGLRASAETDDLGRYRFEGVPAGRVSVVARRAGRLCTYTAPIAVPAGGEAEAPVLTLGSVPSDNLIAGHVRDESGGPIADARIAVFDDRGPRNINAKTYASSGSDGSFSAVVLSGARYTLEVEQHGRGRRQLLLHDIAAGTHDVVLQFRAKRLFELVVADARGRPIEPTGAWAYDERGGHLHLGWEEGQDGRRLAVVPEQEFSLTVQANGYLPARLGPFEPDEVPARVEVQLREAGVVTGRVLAAGQPLEGATVHVHWLDPRRKYHRFARDVYTRLQGARGPTAKTDPDGRFELSVHRAGRYVLHAEADAWARGESAELDLSPEMSLPGVEITLAEPAAVEGRVLTGGYASVEGRVIAATRGDGHAEVCVTDADGRFRFDGLAPGGWQVRACETDDQKWLRMARTWPDRELDALPVDVQLLPGRTSVFDVDLTGRYGAELRGRLVLDGIDCGGWRVSLWSQGPRVFTKTAADGSFSQRGATGMASLSFFGRLPAGGQLEVRQSVTVGEGPNSFYLQVPTGGVELVDLPASSSPPEQDRHEGYALVWMSTPDDAPKFTYRFDPGGDGTHRIDALPAGSVELRRREDDRTSVQNWEPVAAFEIIAGQHARVAPR